MEFNKRKFNIIVIFTVCLICFIVVFTAVDFSSAINTDLIPNTSADSEEEKPLEKNPEEEIVPTEIESAPIFTARQKWQCLNYALNNLEKYDYRMMWNQKVPNAVNDQIIEKSIYKTSGKYYIKIAASGYESFKNFAYVDAATAVLNFNGNKTTLSYSDYSSAWGRGFHQLPYSLMQPLCEITKFDSDPLKDYYTLDVSISSAQFADYAKLMTKISPKAKDPQIESINLSIKIDKESGTIKSMRIIEIYSIFYIVRVPCVSTINLFFTYGNFSASDAVNEIKNATK